MEKFIEVEAPSVELAIEKALVELNTTKEKVEVEVLAKGGLFGKAKVKVSLKDNVVDRLGEFLNGTLERMGLVSRAKIVEENDIRHDFRRRQRRCDRLPRRSARRVSIPLGNVFERTKRRIQKSSR